MKSLRDSKLLWVFGTLSIICAIFPGSGEYAKLASAIYWFGGIVAIGFASIIKHFED